MLEESLKIHYDPVKRIWSSVHNPYRHLVQGSLGERFLKTMRTTDPKKIIDHFYDTNRQKTVKEVYEQSIVVAKNLQRLGIQKGDVVVFFSMNNEDVAVLTMGCILIGAVVNFFEVHLPEGHIDSVFSILDPTMILHEENHKQKCLQSLKRLNLQNCNLIISIDGPSPLNAKELLLSYGESIDFAAFESVQIEDPENELALLILTSGSTGQPKVVQLSHTLVMHGCYIWWNDKHNCEPLSKESIVFSFSPLRWISQDSMLLQSMLMGIRRVSSCGAPSPAYGLELLHSTQITHIFTAPSIFHEILRQLKEDDVNTLKSLRVIQLGGEAPSTHLIQLAKKHCIKAKVFKCYGMTEMATCITNDEDINGGKLLPGYQVQILNEHLKPQGPNQRGQIAIKPPYVLKGYKSPDNTSYYNENGLFINGDYGFIDDQKNLHIMSRYKDLIYSNDLVLVPNILEHMVMDLPEISIARLAGYRKSLDDSNEIAAFFVILANDKQTSENEITGKIFSVLKAHLRPEELHVIQHVYYVDSVPVTTCGKVDRVALKNLAYENSQKNKCL